MALLGWDNAVDAAALFASAALAGSGPELLRVPVGSDTVAWQTPYGVTGATLTLVAPAAVAFRAVCLSRTNLTPSATLRVVCGTYDSGTVAGGVVAGVGQALHVLPAPVNGTTLAVTISDPGNPDGFLNVPLAFAGPAADVRIGADFTTEPTIRSDDVTTRGGQELVAPLFMQRGWSLTVPMLPDADTGILDALESAALAGRNILFVPRVGNARAAAESVFGRLKPGRRGLAVRTGRYRTWQATITERL